MPFIGMGLFNINYFLYIRDMSKIKWNYDNCYEEARKYTYRGEFKKGSNGAYIKAHNTGWINDYTWFTDERFDLYKDKIDLVYAYEFPEYNSVYVGRTLIRLLSERHNKHVICEKETTYKFCKEHNIIHPEPKILESDLLLKEGCEREGYWVNWYIENGWNVINKARTGSIGRLGRGKWNYKTCYEEAKKYKCRSEYFDNSPGAYKVSLRNKWLNDYTWFETYSKPRNYWNYETCYEEAKKYTSRSKFRKASYQACDVARMNGWLDDYTWFIHGKKPKGYWNYETCYKEAKKYNDKISLKKGSSIAYQTALKNGWIDDYTWFIKHKGIWTLEKCKEVAIKYTRASDFKNNNKGCYEYARIHGLLNELVYKDKGTTNGSPTPSATLPIQLELAFEYA